MIFNWKKTFVILPSVISICFLSYLFTSSVHAQTVEQVYDYVSSVNENDFDIEISPENPGPYQSVTLHLSSNLVDTNRYLITWTVDGKTALSGIGKRNLVVTTKDYGQTTTISMTIVMVESSVTKTLALTPQDSTILWEAVDSYVPPFYQGKKLPAYESLIRIAAIPNFLGARPSSATKNSVYIWKRNKSVIPDGGGYGKDSILIEHNRVRNTEFIEVGSSTTNGSAQANASILIRFFDPKIVFYQRDTTTGLRDSLGKTTSLFLTKETTLEAEPYFFSVLNKNPNLLKLDWSINGKPVVLGDVRKKTSLTLQLPGESGSAQVGIKVENTTKLFQSAESALNIVFRK